MTSHTENRGGAGAGAAPDGPRVAFQGELGAFSEEAVRTYFGATARPLPCRDFAGVGRALEGGGAEFGMLPIENSLAGSVAPSYDVLGSRRLAVVGEVVSPIHHCVLGVPGARLEGVRRVLSHPVALAQCTRFFAEHTGVEAVSFYDTAGAAREVAERKDPAQAAIASRMAAGRYGLEILAADVEDRPDNQTRFLVTRLADSAGRDAEAHRAAGAGLKTAVLAETLDTPGALVKMLLPFSERGINLCKLESRPGEEPWTYRFFIEVECGEEDPGMHAALDEAARFARVFHVLGSYPRWVPAEGGVRNAM